MQYFSYCIKSFLFFISFQNLTLQIGKVLELEDVDNGLDDYRSTSNLTFEQYRYYLFKEVKLNYQAGLLLGEEVL